MGDTDKISSSFQPYLANRQIHRESHAILAPSDHFPSYTDNLLDAGLAIGREIAVMRLPVWRGHEHRDVPPERFAPAITEQPLGSRIEKPNQAVFIDDDDAVGHGVEDGGKFRLDVL